mmetsp:Transcript_28582/g.42247  ORF Transcript_28582/g.42247 Transcript_28582/m.42247 type:complete len:140 (+) Transcript_28582:135-554(+)
MISTFLLLSLFTQASHGFKSATPVPTSYATVAPLGRMNLKSKDSTDDEIEQSTTLDLWRQVFENSWIKDRKKSRPRFYTYDTCKAWLKDQWIEFDTEKDWHEWIAIGEKRNCLVPSNPEEEYGRQGSWMSWDDFLSNFE